MTAEPGRRERKKAQTRKSIADAALELFLTRGYDAVNVKEIAAAADVSESTLFQHFPSKESMVFDRDDEMEADLLAAVRERREGRSIPAALREHILRTRRSPRDPEIAEFRMMVQATPALKDYMHRLWMRHETALAAAIAEEIGAEPDDVRCAAFAHFALQAREIIARYDSPRRAAETVFGLLEDGWANVVG